MKILQLALTLGSGGAERIAVGLCNRFAENQDDEIILVSILDDAIQRNNHYFKDLSPRVRFINLHCNSGLQPKAIWRVFKIIKRERPDLVHCHTLVALLLFPIVCLKNILFFHTIHTMPDKQLAGSSFLKRLVAKYLFRNNKVLPITISERCHQLYYKTYRINNDICITNGSEVLKVTEKKELVKEAIENLKDHSDATVFIHVARHHPVKNHDRLFSTFLRLEREGEHFILIVLGEHYEPWETKLKDSKCIFLLGAKNNVGDYMDQADFFVLSSDFEGLPMTLLEAMSMGVVPISTPAGGIIDVIEDGVNGYLSKDFSDENFYQKVKQAICEKGTISPEKIKKDYEEKYSMDICAQKYYETYKKALTI